MKKLLIIVLILAMAAVPVFADADKGTLKIGNNTANTLTVPASKGLKVLVTLADDAVTRDAAFDTHIADAANKFGIDPTISVNGTYFNAYYDTKSALSYPNNCATIDQTIMIDGQVVIAGGDGYYGTLGFTKDGKALIDQVQIKPYVEIGGKQYFFWGVNNLYKDDYAVMLFTPEVYYTVYLPKTMKVLTVKDGKITQIYDGSSFTVESGEKVIVFGNMAWTNALKWNDALRKNTKVTFKNEITSKSGNDKEWQNVVTAVAGNPWILSNGENVTSQNRISEAKLGEDYVAGRTFVALDKNNNLTVGVVTASPNQLAESLAKAGYRSALCLDGGGSSALAGSGKKIQNAGRKLSNVIHILSAEDAAVVKDPNYVKLPFTDVTLTSYYRDAVAWAYKNNITKGTSDTTFGPDSSCTRGQVVTFLWRVKGCPEPAKKDNPFTDIKESDYYYKAVLWAVEKNITNGAAADRFDPDGTCSNAHILTFIYRAVTGKLTSSGEWYDDALSWAKQKKLLEGTYEGEFDISADCPRCNVVEYLYRYSK